MNEEISARGERAAIGGYLPQFDEFAWFVYLNLINNKLEWIRVADPKAEKLDDIQYATHSELHAYQVKWTIADANISFTDFIKLIPLITCSWKSLKTDNPNKKVIPHLITNKSASSHDSLKDGSTKIGSFANFINEVWIKLKLNQLIDAKWNPIIAEFQKATNLDDIEFDEFIRVFDFQHSYQRKRFSVEKAFYSIEDKDLIDLSRFLWEQAGSEERNVEFSRWKIIQSIGWTDRFKTVFNHELIVDRQKYQPIQSTIDLLNSKLAEHKSGYLFLQGSPGAGKSTLLNQWSKGLKTRIVRYYAFDFVNPSSHLNFYDRGNATHLFFDLVFQLKKEGIYKRDVLPYKDLHFLIDVFNEQLKALGEDFATSSQHTIIIIDGLDHVPREYKLTTDSFLRALPLPASLPEGVFIILGSQSYELDDIQYEIKTEFERGDRTIHIDSLKKEDVYKYISKIESLQLSDAQKLQVFEKSQGHPLYLSYLIERIIESNAVDKTINSFETINGSIETYYKKIWSPIQKEENLIQFLGLIARINGSINIQFVKEWGIERSVLRSFKEKAEVLFNKTENTWWFFHNSFKQFLLYHTSLNYLTNEFDQEENLKYHNQLADFYLKSKVEKLWKRNYHLFQAKQYDKFVLEVMPDNFIAQLLDFRPVEEIRQDIKLGIEIARQTKNINLLVKYLFSLAEIEKQQFNIDPASFTEEFLAIGKPDIARDYLRTGNVLHCSNAYAFKASRLFTQFGYNSEGKTLFHLAYPEIITDFGITIDASHRYEEIRDTLEEWTYMAPYFETTENILLKIDSIEFSENTTIFGEKEADLKLKLIANFGYSLIDQNKWEDVKTVLEKIGTTEPIERDTLFRLIQYAIEQCLEVKDNNRASEYLSILTSQFTKEKTKPFGKIYIADLVYKVTQNVDETLSWIDGIKQPLNLGKEPLSYDIDHFIPLIKLNKLLNLCGKGVSITSAIPPVIKGSDEEVLVEFKRMLCLIAQILADGILQNSTFGDVTKRVFPIVRFYYKDVSHRNSYWYKLTQAKGQYFDFLISAISLHGKEKLEALGNYLFNEFADKSKYWSSSDQRKIIESLLNKGFNPNKAKTQLSSLETSMLYDHDIDGRVTECVAHSKVYISLGEYELGEKWLKQSIQESIGVGYRKDYQFSTWIEWLRKINLKDPSKATQRIKWFLSHLNHIKKTTEGRAYWNASEELLDATYEHNLNDGLEQTIWQLEHDLVDFRDAITLFIKHFVSRVKNEYEYSIILLLHNGLYLLIVESANTFLLKAILEKGYKLLQETFLEKYLPTIITAIKIKSLEQNRYYLLSEIEIFCSKNGIKINDYYYDFKVPKKSRRDDSSYSNSLTLKENDERLDESEVLKRIESFEDFKNLLQAEDQAHSSFNWSKVIDKISFSMTSGQINEVTNLTKIGRKESEFYAKLSKLAFEIGDSELSESLANKSLELSSSSGWVKRYDGGSRLEAFDALKKVNPTLSTEKAFEVFAHDILNGNYSGLFIEHLDDIVPLLTKNYVEEEIWVEVFNYLQRLMSNSKPDENLPVLQSVEKPISETLVDYLLYLSKNPILLVQEESIVLLAQYINQNNDYALTQILSGEIDDYSSMDVVMALRELNSPKIEDVKSIIQNFALSKDYLLRENAKQILNELGEDIPYIKNIKLPSIYSLHLSEPQKLQINKEIDPYFPTIDITNPRDLIRPFEFLINILSEESGINESNLIYRTHAIMKEIGKEEEWTVEYEKKLRNHLEDIYLKYSYPRPRVITSRRAIMHVTNELIDSGTIYDAEKLRAIFIAHDYAVFHFKEIEKPDFMQTITESDFGGVGNDWIERISESKRLNESLLNYKENFKIIAEYSQVTNLDWGSPTEEYMYQIAVNDKFDNNENYIFCSVFHKLSSDYHNLVIDEPSIIVIRYHRFNQFNIKSNWIAINPVLAKYLGWLPEPSKLFAWKNTKGELMAESVYWCNGNIQMNPRKDSEVGEGWFVVVSENAYQQIKSVAQNLFLQKKLVRTKREDSGLMTREIFNVVKIQ